MRIPYVDKLKALAMLLVVWGHTMYFCIYHEERSNDPILNIICTFHVPLFFFLSGFVVSKAPDVHKFLRKAYKFMMPMLVVGFINALLFDGVRDFFLNGGHFGYWYLLTLTIFYLLLMPFQLTNGKKDFRAFIKDVVMAVAIWGAIIVLMHYFDDALSPLNLWGAFSFWPFFVIGYLFRKYYSLTIRLIDRPIKAVVLSLSYIILLVFSYPNIDHLPLLLDFAIALVAIAALFALFRIFSESNTFVDRQMLLIGNSTLDIYIYHYFFIRCINLQGIIGQSLFVEFIVTSFLALAILYASLFLGKLVRKIINQRNNSPALLFILVSLPFVLWGVCGIGPTFDDYTTLQSPWYIQISDAGYFFPDAVRRPFDFLLGCIVGWWPALFPVLNHLLIILGHTLSAILVFTICRQLNFSSIATNIATIFFFFSPATLGATLACDGFNQTYSQLWGLLSLLCYLKERRKLWIVCIIMAALSKENGLAWAIVPPIVGYAFQFVDRRNALRHIGYGLLIAIAYFLVFGIIYLTGIIGIDYDGQYTDATLLSHAKDFIQLMAYTWVPADYMSIVYPPTRNLPIAIVTVLLSLPFILLLASKWKLLKSLQLLLLIGCFFILLSPHLITLVSIMHNYAALSVAAIIIGFIVSRLSNKKMVIASFVLFIAAALFTDIHHCLAARQSALLGKHMALLAISKAPQPLERAFCINIDNADEPRYSNFCVRPVDAFAWGLSVRHYSHYAWNTAITEVTLPQYDEQRVKALADSALQAGNEAVWVAGYDKDPLIVITRE